MIKKLDDKMLHGNREKERGKRREEKRRGEER